MGVMRVWNGTEWVIVPGVKGDPGPQGDEGPPGPAQAIEVIDQDTLASAVSELTIPVPGGYDHVRLIMEDLVCTTGSPRSLRLNVNNDASSNSHYLGQIQRSGGTVSGITATSTLASFSPSLVAASISAFRGLFDMMLYSYAKTGQHRMYAGRAAVGADQIEFAGRWINTADPITSLVFTPGTDQIDAGLRWTLYGIKGPA